MDTVRLAEVSHFLNPLDEVRVLGWRLGGIDMKAHGGFDCYRQERAIFTKECSPPLVAFWLVLDLAAFTEHKRRGGSGRGRLFVF